MPITEDKKAEIILCPSDHKNYSDWLNIFDFLDNSLDYSRVESALDLGSGTGNLIRHFIRKNKECACTAVDRREDLLNVFRNYSKNITCVTSDINENLPFPDNSFDFVSCVGTLHYPYIKDSLRVLSEMKRVSKKYIFVDFLLKNSPYSFLQTLRHPSFIARKYTKHEIGGICESLGLKQIGARGGRTALPCISQYLGREIFCILEK